MGGTRKAQALLAGVSRDPGQGLPVPRALCPASGESLHTHTHTAHPGASCSRRDHSPAVEEEPEAVRRGLSGLPTHMPANPHPATCPSPSASCRAQEQMSKQSCALRGAGLGRGAPGGGDPQMGRNSMGVRTPQMLKQGGGHLPAALPLYSLVNLVLSNAFRVQ